MKTRVLVMGRTGMLGHMVLGLLSGEADIEPFGTDVSDPDDPFYYDAEKGEHGLDSVCNRAGGVEYIINCIGVTSNRIDTNNSVSVRRAIKINSMFPHGLAAFAEKSGIRVIHISTDGVFSGEGETYDEGSPADCHDVYGKTKSLGEAFGQGFLNIRCSIVGPSPVERGGLYEWVRSRPDGAVVSGYINHYWNGVTTLQYAELCLAIIRERKFEDLRHESHLFHFSPNESVSKFELMLQIKESLRKNITVIPEEHGNGIVRRVLKTKYEGIRTMFPGKRHVGDMIENLYQFTLRKKLTEGTELP